MRINKTKLEKVRSCAIPYAKLNEGNELGNKMQKVTDFDKSSNMFKPVDNKKFYDYFYNYDQHFDKPYSVDYTSDLNTICFPIDDEVGVNVYMTYESGTLKVYYNVFTKGSDELRELYTSLSDEATSMGIRYYLTPSLDLIASDKFQQSNDKYWRNLNSFHILKLAHFVEAVYRLHDEYNTTANEICSEYEHLPTVKTLIRKHHWIKSVLEDFSLDNWSDVQETIQRELFSYYLPMITKIHSFITTLVDERGDFLELDNDDFIDEAVLQKLGQALILNEGNELGTKSTKGVSLEQDDSLEDQIIETSITEITKNICNIVDAHSSIFCAWKNLTVYSGFHTLGLQFENPTDTNYHVKLPNKNFSVHYYSLDKNILYQHKDIYLSFIKIPESGKICFSWLGIDKENSHRISSVLNPHLLTLDYFSTSEKKSLLLQLQHLYDKIKNE